MADTGPLPPPDAGDDPHLTERRLGGTTLVSGGFLELRRDDVLLPDGNHATREFIQHGGAVAVVPLLDDGRLVLVRQYRYPVAKVLLEWPATPRPIPPRASGSGSHAALWPVRRAWTMANSSRR